MSLFLSEDDEDVVPDSFFINNQCSPYSNININCTYLDPENLKELDCDKFSIFSLNIQSLPAKFVEFSDLINQFSVSNSCPDVICLQETWKIFDNSFFPLPDYHTLETNVRQNARGGGELEFMSKTI